MQKRLKLRISGRGYSAETFIEAQVKINYFWETVACIPVTSGRDAVEAKRLATERLDKFLAAGFDDKGEINL